jgi:hypothetical protein
MPRLGALLFPGRTGLGAHNVFTSDAPTLPPQIDAKAQSLSVLPTSVPIAFFGQPKLSGAGASDLPLNFHPAAIRASVGFAVRPNFGSPLRLARRSRSKFRVELGDGRRLFLVRHMRIAA